MAVDPIILDFRANTKQINQELNSLDKKVTKVGKDSKKAGDDLTEGFKKSGREAKKVNKEVSGLDKAMTRLASRVAAAFAVDAIVRFTQEAVALARTAKGVETAFNNIRGANIRALREATRGTVSDLQLMQSAVQASNLGVPIQELGNLFAFATQRARETGESVDFLVNSIVTGLGRKSTLILDNLGISATALKEELGGVSAQSATTAELTEALGRIIERDMSDAMDSGIDKSQRLDASLENLSVAIGNALIPAADAGSNALANLADNMTTVVSSDNLNGFERLLIVLAEINPALGAGAEAALTKARAMDDLQREIEDTQSAIVDYLESQGMMNDEIKEATQGGLIGNLKDQIKALNEELELAATQGQINDILNERDRLEERLNEILNNRNKLKRAELELTKSVAQEENSLLEGRAERQTEQLENREEQVIRINDAEQEGIIATNDIWAEGLSARLDLAQGFFSAVSELAATNAGQSKELAIFSATINAALAATKVFAEVAPPASFILAATIATQLAAQISRIENQQVPSFYEGTPFFSDSPSKGRKKDDGFARLHYGEAVIPAEENRKYKGLTEAMVKGKTDKWIYEHQVLPALLHQRKELEKQKTKDFASNMAASLAYNLPDARIVKELKRTRTSQSELLRAMMKRQNKNPYRA